MRRERKNREEREKVVKRIGDRIENKRENILNQKKREERERKITLMNAKKILNQNL